MYAHLTLEAVQGVCQAVRRTQHAAQLRAARSAP